MASPRAEWAEIRTMEMEFEAQERDAHLYGGEVEPEPTLEELAREYLDAVRQYDPRDRFSEYERNYAGSAFMRQYRAEHPDGVRVFWSDAVDLAKEVVDED